MKRKFIASIDALRFLCAILVVALHVSFYPNPYYRVAVPIFYMITGYFLVSDLPNAPIERILKSILKAVKLTLMANLIYFVVKFLILRQTHLAILELILFGDAISFHLWYLTSLIEGLLCIWIIKKYTIYKVVPYLIVLGFLANFILGDYSCFFFETPPRIPISGNHTVLDCNRNFFTTALPFLLLGGLMPRFHNVSLRQAGASTVLFGVIMIIEYNFLLKFYPDGKLCGDTLVSTIFMSMAVMQMFLKMNNSSWVIHTTAKWGRKFALDIYIYHILIKIILLKVISFSPFEINVGKNNIWFAVLVFLLTVGFSWVLNNTVRKWLADKSQAVG